MCCVLLCKERPRTTSHRLCDVVRGRSLRWRGGRLWMSGGIFHGKRHFPLAGCFQWKIPLAGNAIVEGMVQKKSKKQCSLFLEFELVPALFFRIVG